MHDVAHLGDCADDVLFLAEQQPLSQQCEILLGNCLILP